MMELDLIPIYRKAPLSKDWQTFFKNSKEALRKAQEAEKEKNNKTEKEIDQNSILELIKGIIEAIEALDEKFTTAIEAIAEKIDEIAETQSQRPQGQPQRQPVTQRDLRAIEDRANYLGLCGEVRKILPFQVIGGKIEKS